MRPATPLLLALGLAACPVAPPGGSDGGGGVDGTGEGDGTTPPPCAPAAPEFDDHTRHGFENISDFMAFSDLGATPVQCKFVLTRFQEPACGQAYFMDGTFYALHDEWFWFRLLNGAGVEGVGVEPLTGQSFANIEAIYAHYQGQALLPLGLKWSGDRLYSPLFYDLVLNQKGPREMGVGSVLHYDAHPDRVIPEELWIFELEFPDVPSEADVAELFDRLTPRLPAEVGQSLRWLARSSAPQEALAATIRAGGGPYADRVVTYEDLVVAGEVVAYNEGITAGRIKRFAKGTLGNAAVAPEDLVILEAVPDDLAPVAGIATAVPQTPLAHLNLLAKSRGTPNAYVAGIYDDPKLEEWEWFHIPAIYKVSSQGVVLHDINKAQYDQWIALKGTPSFEIPQVNLAETAYWADMVEGGFDAQSAGRPIAGGKCTGMLALHTVEGIETPLAPACITIRGYAEHLASFRPALEALLQDGEFLADARVRFVVLEGAQGFADEHAGSADDLAWLEAWQDELDPASQKAQIIAAGGVKELVRAKPLDAAYQAMILEVLSERYATLGELQGLRFRSSSTVEDIVGFNGAGLYDSNTGYLHPEAQPTDKLKARSIAWALKKTWSSYWTFGAFEERKVAEINHLDGNMAVLVHPAFTDEHELANGVMTFSMARSKTGTSYELVVNVQDGVLSVTNPPPGVSAQPEVDRLAGDGASPPPVERLLPSSEVPPGSYVLSEGELVSLFLRLKQLANGWLDHANLAYPPAQRSSTLVLDLELKKMAAAWPARASGETAPADRLVYKQVRTLEQPIVMPPSIVAGPIPRDLLSVASGVREWTCTTPYFSLVALEVSSDPSRSALLPYALVPFTARVTITFPQPPPGFAVPAGQPILLDHTQVEGFAHPGMPTSPWIITVTLAEAVAAQIGFSAVSAGVEGPWSLTAGQTQLGGMEATCTAVDLVVGPSAYLEQILKDAGK